MASKRSQFSLDDSQTHQLTNVRLRRNRGGDYKTDCDDDQWDQIVKVDHNARFMRNKSWPYWEHWQDTDSGLWRLWTSVLYYVLVAFSSFAI
ncbi:hypothetical protein AAHA92_21994 [Salvia divinorum]|uniref:Uncharacterized protein n=1 Tax=Salvia divinorum TaxID=28513 RepID=A0ABD1GM82_SALDI